MSLVRVTLRTSEAAAGEPDWWKRLRGMARRRASLFLAGYAGGCQSTGTAAESIMDALPMNPSA